MKLNRLALALSASLALLAEPSRVLAQEEAAQPPAERPVIVERVG